MKVIFALSLALLFQSSVVARTDMLVLGFDNYPPFTGRDGTPRVAVDLMTRAMLRLDKNVDMIMVKPGEFEEIFTNDRIEGSPALWYSKERAKQMIFSDPIFQNRLMLVGRKRSGAASMNLKSIKGKKISVVEGYAYGPKLENSGAELIMGVSDQDNMLKLLNGDVDFALIEEMLLTYAKRVQREKFEEFLEVSAEPLLTKKIHFAVKKEVPGAKQLVKDLNKEIKAMLRDGTYHEIMGVGRLVADIDGDGQLEMVIVGDPAETLNPEEVYADFASKRQKGKMTRWYVVDKKLYASLEDIPAEKRARMKNPEATASFEFEGL